MDSTDVVALRSASSISLAGLSRRDVLKAPALGAAAQLPTIGRLSPAHAASNTTETTRFEYDPQGRPAREIRPDGVQHRFIHDQASRITQVEIRRPGSLLGRGSVVDTVSISYDTLSRPVGLRNSTGTVGFTYDGDDRIVGVREASGQSIAYAYDPWGAVAALTLPSSRLAYTHDMLGKLVLVEHRRMRVEFELSAESRQVVRKLPGGVTSVFRLTALGELSAIRHTGSDGQTLCAFEYTHDLDGRTTAVIEHGPGWRTVKQYEYDALGRLTRETRAPGGSITYEYNPPGDRIARTDLHGRTEYAYNAAGQLIRAGDVTFTYDANGNLASRRSPSGEVTYSFDATDRLVGVKSSAGEVRYSYDGTGQRTGRSYAGTTTTYLTDRLPDVPQVVAEQDGDRRTRDYTLAGSRVMQHDGAGGTVLLLEDALGSTRCVVDRTGKVLARYDYTAFGEPTLVEGTAQTDYLFTGEHWDAQAMLIYLRARYYDPSIGRFLSPDPIAGLMDRPQSFNRYAYAENDPVNLSDPLGLQAGCIGGWMHAACQPQSIEMRRDRAVFQMFEPRRQPQVWGQWANHPLSPWSAGGPRPAAVPPSRASSRIVGHPAFGPTLMSEVPGWVGVYFSTIGNIGLAIGAVRAFGRGDYSEAAALSGRLILKGLVAVSPQGPLRYTGKALDKVLDWAPIVSAPYGGTSGNSYREARIMGAAPRRDGMAGALDDHRRELNDRSWWWRPPPAESTPRGSSNSDPAPKVGGVYLDQIATVLGELGGISGMMFDEASGQLILLGEADTRLPRIRPHILAAAIRAAYTDSPHAPGMTIDPDPRNPTGPTMLVRFFGNTENTKLGWIMFECDRLMKGYSVGVDNLTGRPFVSSVPGYRSMAAMQFEDRTTSPHLWNRFWLVPEPISARAASDGALAFIDPPRMRVRTETMRWANGRLVPAGGAIDHHAEAFAAHMTAQYRDYAAEHPVFAELEEVTAAAALAQWMKARKIPVDWTMIERWLGAPHPTPSTTPAARAQFRETTTRGNRTATTTLSVLGGVEMRPALAARTDASLDAAATTVRRAARDAARSGRADFAVNVSDRQVRAVALAPGGLRRLGSYNVSESDLPALAAQLGSLPGVSRSYNSFHNQVTEFGRSWSLLMPRLAIESAGEGGQQRFLSVAGRPDTRVQVQRFQLTSMLGLGSERFDEPFIDQELARVGFRPTAAASRYRALYPERDAYRLVGLDGTETVFDTAGRLLGLLHTGFRALYGYDGSGRLAELRHSLSGQPETVLRFQRDAQGRISSIAAGDRRAAYTYDAQGNLAKVTGPGGTMEYRYDERGLLIEVLAGGETIARNRFDEAGRLVEQRGADGTALAQTVVPRPDGGHEVRVTAGVLSQTATYDAELRLTRIVEPDGTVATWGYPAPNRVVIDVAPPGEPPSRIEQTADGRPVALTTPRGNTTFRYFENGLLSEILREGARAAAFGYDRQGRVAELGYADGTIDRLARDAAGRPTALRRSDGASGRQEEISLRYTPAGELAELAAPGLGRIRFREERGATVITHGDTQSVIRRDAQGRLLAFEGPEGLRVVTTYAADGSLTQLTTTRGRATRTLTIDASGTLTVQGFRGEVTTLRTDGEGRLATVEQPLGSRTAYAYDAAGRLVRVLLAPTRCIAFAYDGASSRLASETHGGCG